MKSIHDKAVVLESFLQVYERRMQEVLQAAKLPGKPTLKLDQFLVLHAVDQAPGTSQKELAASLAKDAPSITRILDSLEELELVKRRPNQKDRRKYALFTSANGKVLLKRLVPRTEKASQELEAELKRSIDLISQ